MPTRGCRVLDSIIGENAAVTGRRGRINLGDSSEVEVS
jgi:hypothetical protein